MYVSVVSWFICFRIENHRQSRQRRRNAKWKLKSVASAVRYKQFKNKPFQKIDLHGLTVDEAYQKVLSYLKTSFKKKNLLHIVITGLGNKSQGEEFFTGKIRKQFPQWLETESFQEIVKSYSPCKIKHGGLGAFYVKLRINIWAIRQSY